MDREILQKIFRDFNPDRKDITNNQYAVRLSRLAKDFEATDDEFLKDTDKIINYLDKKHTKTTYGNVLYSIIGYLEARDKDELSKVYRKRKELVDEQIRNNYDKNKFFGKQEENMVSYEKLVKFVDTIGKMVAEPSSENASYIENWERQELKNVYLLFKMYLRYPTRNDYANLQFITWRNYKKIPSVLLKEQGQNYIVIKSRTTPFFSISDYKMSKKYGTKITLIEDKELKRMLLNDFKERGEKYLFTYPKKNNNEPFEKYYVTQLFTKWTKKILELPQGIGTTLLYKIIIGEASKKYKHALEDDDYYTADHYGKLLDDFAKTRGHTRNVQKAVYSKS